MTRHFTDAELARMARTPREQFVAAVEGGTVDDALATFAALARSFRNFIDGFSAFIAGIGEYVRDTHDLAACAALDTAMFAAGLREIATRGSAVAAMLSGADEVPAAASIGGSLRSGERGAAIGAYDAYERAVRDLHDLAVGRVAAALTYVYRTFGVDELEACLRLCGDRTLLQWMPHDIARPAHVRIAQWARMMSGNFASITVEETDDAFIITQDPCGTCARQVLDGCYASPVDYAVVREPHAITWGRGDVPVYRTHVPVMHDMMPLERIGERWPEITCPQGVAAGPCTVLFRKNGSASVATAP